MTLRFAFWRLAGAAAVCCWLTSAQAQDARCDSLVQERRRAIAASDSRRMEEAARSYISACRAMVARGLIAVALEEVAAARRLAGRYSEAIQSANECLQFQYEAVGCHAEKALALAGMRLVAEARSVLESGRVVGAKELVKAQSEISTPEPKRGVVSPEQAALRIQAGAMRQMLAKRGLERLAVASAAIEGGAR